MVPTRRPPLPLVVGEFQRAGFGARIPPRPGHPQAAEDEAGAGRGTDVIVSGEPNPRADESACSS